MQTNVVEYLSKTVSRYPNKIAIRDSKGEITFFDLMNQAKLVAQAICNIECKKKPIGVFLPKCKEAIISFCGINISQNFYVPLDVKSPVTRIEAIVSVLDSKVIITSLKYRDLLKSFFDGEILVIEDIEESQVEEEIEVLQGIIDSDPVYAIFTSGSTGIPKGVVIPHRGVIDYIDWAVETFGIDSSYVIGNQAPFYFDNSTLDIYLMYATGATLDIIPEDKFIFPAKLINHLNDHEISFIFWVPFVLVNVANFDILSSNKPIYLKDVFFAGEVMPNKHLNYWRKHLPSCRYANLYGPTEITVDCTYYVVEREFADNESLPIGFPCKNSDILILKEDNTLAKENEHGELCVRGSSLALGYYNDWEKTRKAFIQNPLNPNYPEIIYCTGDIVYSNEYKEIMYVGRKDSQIKHNGYRIELGEIETTVLGTDLIDNCCVVYNFTKKNIVLFYQTSRKLETSELRKKILQNIPKYMMPTEFYQIDKIKVNANGKTDRLYYNKQING